MGTVKETINFMVAFFVIPIVSLMLLAYMLMGWRSMAEDLEYPWRDSAIAAATGVSLELLALFLFWTTAESHPTFGNVAGATQFPGVLLSSLLGFGPHGEGVRVKAFYALLVVTNALIYSFLFFAAYAFTQRRNRAR